MGGIGSGVGGGGPRPGAGRPRGSRNRRSRALIAQTQEQTKTDPLDFLLDTVANKALPLKDRISAASASAPYLHARLSVSRIVPQPQTMSDADVLVLMDQLEQRLGKISSGD